MLENQHLGSPALASDATFVSLIILILHEKNMVGVARIELATPAMSTQCSTTELHAHPVGPHQRFALVGGPGKSAALATGHLERAFKGRTWFPQGA